MRSCLFDDHLLTASLVGSPVETAAVGEVDRALDRVRQVLDGRFVAGGDVGREAIRCGHPLRDLEGGAALVLHQLPGAVLYRQRGLTVGPDAPAVGETAVADVEGTLVPSQVAEDVRALTPAEKRVQLVEDELELLVVLGVDGDELPARP